MTSALLLAIAINSLSSPMIAFKQSVSVWTIGNVQGTLRQVDAPSSVSEGAFLNGNFVLVTDAGKVYEYKNKIGEFAEAGKVKSEGRSDLLSVCASRTNLYVLWLGDDYSLIVDCYSKAYQKESEFIVSQHFRQGIMDNIHILDNVILRVSPSGKKLSVSYTDIESREPQTVLFDLQNSTPRTQWITAKFVVGFVSELPVTMDKIGLVSVGNQVIDGKSKKFIAANGQIIVVGLEREGGFSIYGASNREGKFNLQNYGLPELLGKKTYSILSSVLE